MKNRYIFGMYFHKTSRWKTLDTLSECNQSSSSLINTIVIHIVGSHGRHTFFLAGLGPTVLSLFFSNFFKLDDLGSDSKSHDSKCRLF